MSDDLDQHEHHTQQLIGRHDDDLGVVELQGWQPGPAGVATLDFDDGAITVLADVAEPAQVGTVFIGDAAPGKVALIDAVVGAQDTEVHDRIAALGSTPRVVIPSSVDRQRRGSDPGDPPGGPSDVFLRITRLAVLTNELETRALGPGVTAVAQIEAALIGLGLSADLRPVPAPTTLLLQGLDGIEELLAGHDDEWVLLVDHGEAIAELLFAVARQLEATPHLERRVDDLAARVRTASGPGSDVAAAVAAPPMHPGASLQFDVAHPVSAWGDDADLMAPLMVPSPEDRAPHDRDPHSLDVALIDLDGVDVVRAELQRPEVCVTVRDDRSASVRGSGAIDPGWWLRVFCIDDWNGPLPGLPLPVSMAPFTSDQFGTYSAAALLPEHLDEPDLLIDVTAQPLEAWQPPSKRALRQAIRLGQLAARQERVGELAAARNWRRCSDAWATVGDERRAHLAAERARRLSTADDRFERSATPLAFPPFLFDEMTSTSR